MKPVVIHKDLKSENVLLDGSRKLLKLCDFGSATIRITGATVSERKTELPVNAETPFTVNNKKLPYNLIF